jgi:aminoglycoside N3'-acetyltransferase
MISKEQLISDLYNLGIVKGDVLYITINLLSLGYFRSSKNETLSDLVNVFKEVVGEDGAVVFNSYTKSFFRFRKQNLIFDRFSSSYAGPLPNFIIQDKSAFRSKHPTNSVIGYGKCLESIFDSHGPNSKSYSVIGELIKLPNCKFLMIGTVDDSNAPQAMHYAQEVLGYSSYSPYKYLKQVYYKTSDGNRLFTRKDFGGCSAGGYRLFGDLLINDSVTFSYVGNALTALMPALKSFKVIKSTLLKNRKVIQCNNKECIDCYGNYIYNGINVIPFYIRLIFDFRRRIMSRFV